MSVAELIERLQQMPMPHRQVYLQREVRGRFNERETRHDPIRVVVNEGPFVVIRIDHE